MMYDGYVVSTHSRPKAAGLFADALGGGYFGFNTQPPEGGWAFRRPEICHEISVSTHSRPKAAGAVSFFSGIFGGVSTHSRPKAAGKAEIKSQPNQKFQHTAARRRLVHVISYAQIAI